MKPLEKIVFETAWGWCGALVSDDGVAWLALPVKSPDAVRFPGAPAFQVVPHARGAHAAGHPCKGSACARAPWVVVADEFMRQIRAYFEGRAREFTTRTDWVTGTEFQRKVWSAAREIPPGETWTYGELAAHAGHPGAARAVGGCMAKNPTPLLVPCHRVVAASGGLGGFSCPCGPDMKKRLLELERHAGAGGLY